MFDPLEDDVLLDGNASLDILLPSVLPADRVQALSVQQHKLEHCSVVLVIYLLAGRSGGRRGGKECCGSCRSVGGAER